MPGNSFGTLFKITTFGESHGASLGVIIDGIQPNLDLDLAFIQEEMNRRRPGSNSLGTQRKELDEIEVLSGVYNGKTTGTPLTIVVHNTNQKSSDYSSLEQVYRPGHADYTYSAKYKIRDPRGGGRSSGRETLARVIAGAVAKLALKQVGISITAGTIQVGNVKASTKDWNPPFLNELSTPDLAAYPALKQVVEEARSTSDSVGGIIEVRITGVPAGLGNPCFDKLDAKLSYAMMSIGAVKGVEIGEGFNVATLKGSENNDQMEIIDNKPSFKTNHAGGILGGISTGEMIVLRLAIKPTPSIYKTQQTVNLKNENIELNITGRHDPSIMPRAVVVTEAMAAITIYDEYLIWRAYE